MSLRLYNTLTRTIQPFEPLNAGEVSMYVCGPTVYDEPHIGHVRSAYVFDVLRRYLESTGLKVKFVRNVTDVDDKIIEKARQEQKAGGSRQKAGDLRVICQEVTQRYLNSYHEALERLGIVAPTYEPKATEHLDDMINLISQLVLNGSAYEAEGGDVYFAVRKFARYGQLSNRSLDELQAGTRMEPGEEKRDPLDFALWKSAKPDEPSWQSPWGQGRPGWHIECSAMSTKYLGPEFDLHGGGLDLIFPHHENEIAQAQAAGQPFARRWFHHGLLTVNGEKMSKSLKNFVTVQDALQACQGAGGRGQGAGVAADVLKVFFLGAHYRSPLDYTAMNLQAALGRYRRMINFFHRVMNADLPTGSLELDFPPSVLDLRDEFVNAMDDDLNTPKALAALDGLVTTGYAALEPLHRVAASHKMRELGKTFGLFDGLEGWRLSPEQQQLLRQREEARQRRDFAVADQIRASLAAQGLAIEDTPEGPVVLPKS